MTIIQVTQPVIAAVTGLLDDGSVGFNTTMTAVAEAVGVTPVWFDFTPGSKNFYTTWLNQDMLANSPTARFPLMALFGRDSQNVHEQLAAPFSGPVEIGLDVHLSWPKAQDIQDTESLLSSVESTIYTIFQPTVGLVYLQQTLSLTGFGAMKIDRTPMRLENQHWLQSINTVLTFHIVAGN